ncbi:MAG TPA: hypothetical protein VH877_23630 [Polyangia bacterium]|jgi:hypothetical protein|nr:hypothetical protein [Polyangia bacterium]
MLQLGDLKLILLDMLDKRLADVRASQAGTYFEPQLQEQLDHIHRLPAALIGGAPLADQLDETDTRHDGHARVLYFITEAYLQWPDADPALRAVAERVRQHFIPNLGDLNAAYATEAERAIERRPLLDTLKQDLQQFPLAGGKTLLDVATAYLDAGKALSDLLSQRADVPQGNRKAAAALRSATVGVLNRFRSELRTEIRRRPGLATGDLEQRVFGYMDTLAAMRAQAAASAKTTSDGKPPETKPPGGKPPETKPPSKPAETKAAQAQPENKAAQAQPGEAAPGETPPANDKPPTA